MPNIGDIISADNIGRKITKQKRLFIWLACPDCGKERWVRKYYEGKPTSGRCIACGNKHSRDTKVRRMEKHGNWNGGRKRKSGYIHIRLPKGDIFYPMTHSDGYLPEHRLVMARSLGRCLKPWELVHHINGLKEDNRLENLELLPKSEHMGIENVRQACRRLEAENMHLKEQLKHRLAKPPLLSGEEMLEPFRYPSKDPHINYELKPYEPHPNMASFTVLSIARKVAKAQREADIKHYEGLE